MNTTTGEPLREAEERFRAVFDSTSDGIFLHDLETGELTMCNRSCLQMLGYTEEEFTRLHIADIHPEADLPFIRAQIETFLKGGKPIRHDIHFKRKDGSVLLADVSPDMVLLDGKRYVLIILKDITERTRMQDELRRHADRLEDLVRSRTSELQESEARCRSLYHAIADGIFVVGADGRIQDVNNSACAQLGYTHEELVGMPISAISVRPDFCFAEIFDRLRTTGRLSYETAHRRKDGVMVPVELSVTLVEYRGHPTVLGVARDITERQRTQEALQFTQFAIDHTADAAFWMTDDARIFYVNEAACQALGYSRDELRKMTVYDIDPAFTQSMWSDNWGVLKAKKSIVFETVHRAKDGTIHPVEIRANYLEFGGREYDCAFARDITERKQAEEALREKEYLLSESQRMGHIGTWNVDLATDAVTWTSETYRLFGVSPETFVPSTDTLVDLLHPDDRDTMRESMRVMKEGREAGVLEFRVVLPDGSIRVLSGRGELISANGNRPVRLVGTVQDVTEQKRVQAALMESEERYRILLEHSFDGIFVHEDFRIVQLNDRLAEMVGCARSELLGSKAIDLFTADSQERIRQHIRTGAGGCYEVELLRRDGDIVEVESYGAPCRFQGRNARIVGLRDITERKRAEKALRESEERFRTAFEEGTVAMALTSLDSTLLKVNSSFCRMLGFSESDLVGRSFNEITHPDDVAANLIGTRRLACGEVSSFHMEKRYIRKDGVVVWGDMSTASVRDADGRPLYCVTHVQDVTDRKQAEEALRSLNEQLEAQVAHRTEELCWTVDRLRQLTLELSQAEDRERKRIAGILHEDLQQMLAAARFHLNLLAGATCSAEESQEIIGQVRQLLRDAIERSRSLSHELSPAIYQVELMEILNWLARHMQQRHGLIVHVEAHGRVDSSSELLKAFLYKVAQELLFNVVKHAAVREATVRVRRVGSRIHLSVVDHGQGFDLRELERTAGFGLLSIRERIQLLGGQMKIRSRRGAGSRIIIAIPDQGTSEEIVSVEYGPGQAQPRTPAQDGHS